MGFNQKSQGKDTSKNGRMTQSHFFLEKKKALKCFQQSSVFYEL